MMFIGLGLGPTRHKARLSIAKVLRVKTKA